MPPKKAKKGKVAQATIDDPMEDVDSTQSDEVMEILHPSTTATTAATSTTPSLAPQVMPRVTPITMNDPHEEPELFQPPPSLTASTPTRPHRQLLFSCTPSSTPASSSSTPFSGSGLGRLQLDEEQKEGPPRPVTDLVPNLSDLLGGRSFQKVYQLNEDIQNSEAATTGFVDGAGVVVDALGFPPISFSLAKNVTTRIGFRRHNELKRWFQVGKMETGDGERKSFPDTLGVMDVEFKALTPEEVTYLEGQTRVLDNNTHDDPSLTIPPNFIPEVAPGRATFLRAGVTANEIGMQVSFFKLSVGTVKQDHEDKARKERAKFDDVFNQALTEQSDAEYNTKLTQYEKDKKSIEDELKVKEKELEKANEPVNLSVLDKMRANPTNDPATIDNMEKTIVDDKVKEREQCLARIQTLQARLTALTKPQRPQPPPKQHPSNFGISGPDQYGHEVKRHSEWLKNCEYPEHSSKLSDEQWKFVRTFNAKQFKVTAPASHPLEKLHFAQQQAKWADTKFSEYKFANGLWIPKCSSQGEMQRAKDYMTEAIKPSSETYISVRDDQLYVEVGSPHCMLLKGGSTNSSVISTPAHGFACALNNLFPKGKEGEEGSATDEEEGEQNTAEVEKIMSVAEAHAMGLRFFPSVALHLGYYLLREKHNIHVNFNFYLCRVFALFARETTALKGGTCNFPTKPYDSISLAKAATPAKGSGGRTKSANSSKGKRANSTDSSQNSTKKKKPRGTTSSKAPSKAPTKPITINITREQKDKLLRHTQEISGPTIKRLMPEARQLVCGIRGASFTEAGAAHAPIVALAHVIAEGPFEVAPHVLFGQSTTDKGSVCALVAGDVLAAIEILPPLGIEKKNANYPLGVLDPQVYVNAFDSEGVRHRPSICGAPGAVASGLNEFLSHQLDAIGWSPSKKWVEPPLFLCIVHGSSLIKPDCFDRTNKSMVSPIFKHDQTLTVIEDESKSKQGCDELTKLTGFIYFWPIPKNVNNLDLASTSSSGGRSRKRKFNEITTVTESSPPLTRTTRNSSSAGNSSSGQKSSSGPGRESFYLPDSVMEEKKEEKKEEEKKEEEDEEMEEDDDDSDDSDYTDDSD